MHDAVLIIGIGDIQHSEFVSYRRKIGENVTAKVRTLLWIFAFTLGKEHLQFCIAATTHGHLVWTSLRRWNSLVLADQNTIDVA